MCCTLTLPCVCKQDGATPLMCAILAESADCVAALLAVEGIDVNAQDKVRRAVPAAGMPVAIPGMPC